MSFKDQLIVENFLGAKPAPISFNSFARQAVVKLKAKTLKRNSTKITQEDRDRWGWK